MMIKFRGRDVATGEMVTSENYADYDGITFLETFEATGLTWTEVKDVAQYLTNCANGELYDGDEIRIDMEKAAQIVGEGLMLSTIKNTKPNDEAKLYVEYSHYRYRLIWRTPNGRVDTGLDLALISNILECVEVVR